MNGAVPYYAKHQSERSYLLARFATSIDKVDFRLEVQANAISFFNLPLNPNTHKVTTIQAVWDDPPAIEGDCLLARDWLFRRQKSRVDPGKDDVELLVAFGWWSGRLEIWRAQGTEDRIEGSNNGIDGDEGSPDVPGFCSSPLSTNVPNQLDNLSANGNTLVEPLSSLAAILPLGSLNENTASANSPVDSSASQPIISFIAPHLDDPATEPIFSSSSPTNVEEGTS